MGQQLRREWEEFDGALQVGLRAMDLFAPEDRRRQMFEHYRMVVEANKLFNLTRIISPTDAAIKHYADSLSLLATPWVDAGSRLKVLDVGTGAGYPAMPLAIACPTWSVIAIDGTSKKVRFVEESAVTLGLSNLDAMHARAADLVREGDWQFDLIVVRAVGQMDKVLTETTPLLGSSGAVVFYKTIHMEEAESNAAESVARKLRLRAEFHGVDLPCGDEVLARRFIRFAKLEGEKRK